MNMKAGRFTKYQARISSVAILSTLLLVLLATMPVGAQDVETATVVPSGTLVDFIQPSGEDTTSIVEIDSAGDSILVISEEGGDTDTSIYVRDNAETLQLSWTAIAGIVMAAFGTGVGLSLLGGVAFVRAIRNDPNTKLALERLYLSSPPETQARLRGAAVLGRELGELADELTDGQLEEIQTIRAQNQRDLVAASAPLEPRG